MYYHYSVLKIVTNITKKDFGKCINLFKNNILGVDPIKESTREIKICLLLTDRKM